MGAGLAFSPQLFAASRKADEHSWALLSDIHIAQERARVARGVCMTENFSAAINEVLALRKRPAAALICGDLDLTSTRSRDGNVTTEVARRQKDGTWLWVIDRYSVTW